MTQINYLDMKIFDDKTKISYNLVVPEIGLKGNKKLFEIFIQKNHNEKNFSIGKNQ
jgi:hypothetical protein